MSMKSLTGLTAVLKVAQTGNFVTASEQLGLSAAAISKSIKRLETEMGVKLFQRSTRVVSLTSEGERLVAGLTPLLAELDALTQEILDNSAMPKGLLRISMPPNWGRLVFMPLVAEFLSQYPEISLDVSLDPKLSNLIEDKIDLAIRAGALPDSASLVSRPIAMTQPVLCASQEYIARCGLPKKTADFQQHSAVTVSSGTNSSLTKWALAENVEVNPPPSRFVVDDFDAALCAIRQGIGIGRLYDFICEPYLRSGELLKVLPEYSAVPIQLQAVYQDRRLVSPRIRVMIDYLLDHMGKQM